MYDRSTLDTLEFHRSMLIDEVRSKGYLEAIQGTVRPGDVVLDIGSGTGILALFACQAGARHVYAVEQGPVIELARRIVRDNGFEDRVTFIANWSTNVDLEEQIDVIVTETIGNIGFDEGILAWVIDARDRLLAPGGRIVPHSVALMAVPVESPRESFAVQRWRQRFFNFDFSAALRVAANNMHWVELQSRSLLSDATQLAEIELATITGQEIDGAASFTIARDGVMHGIGGWFSAEVAPGITLTNAPPSRCPSWVQGFLPLQEPLLVSRGDWLSVKVQSHGNSGGWTWQASLESYTRHAGQVRQSNTGARQTTLAGRFASRAGQVESEFAPARPATAEVDLFLLEKMDGARSAAELARLLMERFPGRFDTPDGAIWHVRDLCRSYGCWLRGNEDRTDL